MPTIFRDRVEVDGFRFNEFVSTGFMMDIMDGWDDTPELEVTITAFGHSDGAVSADRFPMKEKYLDLGGAVLAETRAEADKARDRLKLLFQNNKQIVIRRYEPNGAQEMTVRLSGKITFERPVEEGFRYLVPVVATDPFKYSVNLISGSVGVFSGGNFFRSYANPAAGRFVRQYPRTYQQEKPTERADLILNNEGDVTTYPTSTVVGPLRSGDWFLYNRDTDQVLSFDVGIPDGSTLVIDHKEQIALLNGYDVGFTMRGEWWGLRPGSNLVQLVAGTYNAEATLTVTARSARR